MPDIPYCGRCRGRLTEAGFCFYCREWCCPFCYDPMEKRRSTGDFCYCRRCDQDFLLRLVQYIDGEAIVKMPYCGG